MKCNLFIFVLLTVIHVSFAQNISILGKITDTLSNQPLPYATIKIGNNFFAANNMGNFSINIDQTIIKKYGINFIYTGYKELHVKELSDDEFHQIKLLSLAHQLSDVEISSGAKAIVEKAIRNIPLNYPYYPFNTTIFERIYQTVNDTAYFRKNDALLKTYAPSYENYKKPIQVSVLQNRDSIKGRDSRLLYRWINGYRAADIVDIVHSRKTFADSNYIQQYEFSVVNKMKYENTEVYNIRFSPKNGKRGSEGNMFIDVNSYAIVKLTATFNAAACRRYARQKELKDYYNTHQVSYTKINNKWFLKNSNSEIHLIRRKYNNFGAIEYRSSLVDLVTLSVDTVNVAPLPANEIIENNVRDADVKRYVPQENWQSIDSLITTPKYSKYITNIPAPAGTQLITK